MSLSLIRMWCSNIWVCPEKWYHLESSSKTAMNWVFDPQYLSFFLKPKSLVKSLAAAFQVRLFDLAKGVEMGELQEHEEWMFHIVWMVLVVKSVVKNDGSMELSKKLLVQWVDFHLVHWCRATQYIQYSHQIAGTFCPTSPSDNRRIPCRRCSSGGQTSSLAAAMARHGIRSGVEDSDPLTGWIYSIILVKLESKDDFMILDLEWPSKDRTLSGMYFSGSASLPQVRLVQLMKTGVGFGTIWAKSKSCIANSMDTNAVEVFVNCKKVFQNLELSLHVQLPVGSMERFPVATFRGTCVAVNLRGVHLALRWLRVPLTNSTDFSCIAVLFGGFGNLATFPNGWHTP